MYDYYLTKEQEKNLKKNFEISMVNGEKVIEIFDLPATRQKSYYGKAKIICTEKARYLLSYETIVCGLTYGGSFMRLWDGWSATTAKHINDFLKFTRFGLGLTKKEWFALDYYPETGVVYPYDRFNG